VKEEKVLLPPHGAPAQSLGYNTGDIIIIGGDRIINYVGKDGKIHGVIIKYLLLQEHLRNILISHYHE
jgi:hypothetical protein